MRSSLRKREFRRPEERNQKGKVFFSQLSCKLAYQPANWLPNQTTGLLEVKNNAKKLGPTSANSSQTLTHWFQSSKGFKSAPSLERFSDPKRTNVALRSNMNPSILKQKRLIPKTTKHTKQVFLWLANQRRERIRSFDRQVEWSWQHVAVVGLSCVVGALTKGFRDEVHETALDGWLVESSGSASGCLSAWLKQT